MPDSDRASRRAMIAGTVAVVGAAALKGVEARAQAAAKKVDGGFANLLPKQAPEREVPVTPPGSASVKDFYRRCTACQLCVAECPNNVLRPSGDLEHLMQPEMGFEKGWCRPECTRCSELCPAGAIRKISREEKTQYHVGTSHVNLELLRQMCPGLPFRRHSDGEKRGNGTALPGGGRGAVHRLRRLRAPVPGEARQCHYGEWPI